MNNRTTIVSVLSAVLVAGLAGCASDPEPESTEAASAPAPDGNVTTTQMLPAPDDSHYYCSGSQSWCEMGWRCPFGTLYQHCYTNGSSAWLCYCTN
jgi:hypothetical protein